MSAFHFTPAERSLLAALCDAFSEAIHGDQRAVARTIKEMTPDDIDLLILLSERLDPDEFPDPVPMKLNW